MIDVTRVYIIAEAGVNHNGSLSMARELINAAAAAGADAVKFQTFKADRLVSRIAPKAEYQLKTTDNIESQFEMIKKLELSEEAHEVLIEYCQMRGIQFLSTPFDIESLNLLSSKFNLPYIKLPSGEITNGLLLLEAAKTGTPIILSTGMSTLGEVEMALGILAFGYMQQDGKPSLDAFQEAYASNTGYSLLRQKVTLLHCTTEYPAPFGDVNLRAMDTLATAFGLKIGLSDHTSGLAIPIAAAALGAVVIEKHFTLDKSLPGPDHKASLEPKELKEMVESIRQVESALGNSLKLPAPSEMKNKTIARKSLVAATDIRKGEPFTEVNLTVKRPGSGVSPLYYWQWLVRIAERDFKADEVIQ